MPRGGLRQATPFRFATLATNANETYRLSNVTAPSATGTGLTASAKFIAVPVGAGGNVTVIPVDFKDYKRSDAPKVINANGGSPVTDMQFSPHDDLLLATCGSGSVKTFIIPAEGLTDDLKEAKAEVKGLQPCLTLAWHPCASDILAVGAKNALYILDMSAGEIKHEFACPGFGKDVVSISWNHNGTLLAAITKKGHMAVGDIRTATSDFMSEATKLDVNAIKTAQHVQFMGTTEQGRLCVIGQNKYRKPSVCFYEPDDLEDTTAKHTLQLSSGYVLPFYDANTNLLCLTVRSSTTINVYDVSENKQGVPKFQSTTSTTLGQGAKGGCFVAKRACDTHNAEVQRLFIVGSNGVIPHPMKVPRKTKGYDASLYPPAADTVPACSAADWLSGGDAVACTVDMSQPLVNAAWAGGAGAGSAQDDAPSASSATPSPAVSRTSSQSFSRASSTESNSGVSRQTSETRQMLDQKFKQSLYRHLAAKEPDSFDQKSYWFDVKAGPNLPLAKNIQSNGKYWASLYPTIGGGSAIACRAIEAKKGRMPTKVHFARGFRSQATCFDLGSLDQNVLISAAGGEGLILVQRIPEGGIATEDLKEAELKIQAEGKVTRVWAHPYIAECYVSSITRLDETGVITFYDREGEVRKEVEFFEQGIEDVAFHPNCRLIVCVGKENIVRVVDLWKNCVVKAWTPKETRMVNVMFASDSRVIVAGFGARSVRSFSVWDFSGDGDATQLHREELSRDTAQLIPHYDMDRNVLFLAQFGIRHLDLYELNANGVASRLNTLVMTSDIRGMSFHHPTDVDVKQVEIVRSTRISKNSVVPQIWNIPRRRREFFQDDLYPGLVPRASVMAADDFFEADDGSEDVDVKRVSMCPDGMTPLSEAPAEELTERQLRYQAHQQQVDTVDDSQERSDKKAAEMLQVAAAMQANHGGGVNRWDAAQSSGDEVDDDEWGDSSDSD